MIVSFLDGLFSGAFAVRFRERKWCNISATRPLLSPRKATVAEAYQGVPLQAFSKATGFLEGFDDKEPRKLTPPKFNSSPLKIHVWKTTFLLGR